MIPSEMFSKIAALAGSALLLTVSFSCEAVAQPAVAPTVAPAAVAHPAATTHPAASAQPPAATPTVVPADVTPEKGLFGRIFVVAHRDPVALVPVLRPLGSGARGAVLSADSGFGTISVRDFPANLAVMEEALKRLDVDEPSRDVELKIHVLLASSRSDAAASYPEDLKEVVAALRGTLLYKSYTLVTTFVERVKDRARWVTASGVAALPAPEGKEAPTTLQIDVDARGLTIEPGAAGAGVVRLENFSLTASGIRGFTGRASVRTDLSLRPGEKVVVGTSSLGDRGLVVVVSATVVK
jgi:hypothetical protein